MRCAIAGLLQAVLLLSCSTGEVEPQKPDDVGLIFPQRIDFPPTRSLSTSFAEAAIRNEGGTPLAVRLEIPDHYALFGPSVRRLILAPGEERSVRFLFRPNRLGQYDTVAYLHHGSDAHPIWLRAAAYAACEDFCTVHAELSGPCLPAPDGMACGDASECSDGAFCEEGICEPAPARGEVRCDTDCGTEGRCTNDRCALEDVALEPAWTWESPDEVSIVHAHPEGTLLRTRDPVVTRELIHVDQQGRVGWRRQLPEGFGVELPAFEGLLFARSRHEWAAYDLRTGDVRWRRAVDEPRWSLVGKSTSLLLFSRVTKEPGETPAVFLQAVDPLTGDVRWTREVLARTWSVLGERLPHGGLQLAMRGAHLRVAMSGIFWEPAPSHMPRRRYALFALDPATGNERWARAGGPGDPQLLELDDGGHAFVGLHLGYRQGEVHAFDAAGERLWIQSTGTYDHQGVGANGPVRAGMGIVMLRDRTALDAGDGAIRYLAPVRAEVLAGDEVKTGFGRNFDFMNPLVAGFDWGSGETRFSLPLDPSDLYAVEGSSSVRFVHQRYGYGEPLDSALCTIDETGVAVDERQLPAHPQAGRVVHRVTPAHWIRSIYREDGSTRLEAWLLRR